MNARFIWAGRGIDRSEHTSFSNPANYVEYGPIIAWDFTTSTSNHSGEATVQIPLHSGIIPANRTYGEASINAGDHVFLQDMDNPTGYGGVAFMHGTVDKVSYRNNIMTIHFRNPLAFLAENNVKAEGLPHAFDSSYMTTGYPFRQLPEADPNAGLWVYKPNYVGDPVGWKPMSIINHLVLEFAGANVGGPFSGVSVDPSSANDGLFMFPNFELGSKVSLLNAILQLSEATRWQNANGTLGWGHEILANIAQSGAGFSTELFVFRRGAFTFPQTFVYGDAAGSEIPIIDYDFPEITTPTSSVITAGRNVTEEESALTLQEINSSVFTSINNIIYRASAGLLGNKHIFKSSGRATFKDYPWLTNKDAYADAMMGAMYGIGPNRGGRVGKIRVAGWVSNTLFPGFLATLDIPEAGLNNQQLIIDEVHYSEPEGITEISFNRASKDNLLEQLKEFQRREEVLTSRATSCIDSGWIKANGNVNGEGRWDFEPEGNTGTKRHPEVAIVFEGAEHNNNYSFNFTHRLGSIPRQVRFEVAQRGIGAGANRYIAVDTITEVPSETYVAETQSYYGCTNFENSPYTWRTVYHHHIAYNKFLGQWFERDQNEVYLRCRVYP